MRARVRAERDQDIEAFARLTTDEFTLTNARGRVVDKSTRLEELRVKPPPTFTTDGDSDSTIVHGDNVAIRTRRVVRDDGARLRIITVWVKLDGQWKAAATQVTPILD